MTIGKMSRVLLAGVATLALATAIDGALLNGHLFGSTLAYAQGNANAGSGNGNSDSAGGGEGGGGKENAGNSGAGDNGQGNQGAGQGSEGKGSSGGSDEGDTDGKGPQAGQPTGNQGGSPAWASEGIPEVELGRLNVIRSPDHVLDRALAETVANFDTATMESLYELSASAFASEIAANWDTVTIIDSPLENLAVLVELWTTGTTSLPDVNPASIIDLSAILIGVASDKYIPVSEDTVRALAVVTGTSMSDAMIATIADKAEIVRIAVLEGHG